MALGGAAARSAGRPSSSHLWQEPSRLSRMQELSVRMQRRARATAARTAQFGKFGGTALNGTRLACSHGSREFFGVDFGSCAVNFSPRVLLRDAAAGCSPSSAPRDHGHVGHHHKSALALPKPLRFGSARTARALDLWSEPLHAL